MAREIAPQEAAKAKKVEEKARKEVEDFLSQLKRAIESAGAGTCEGFGLPAQSWLRKYYPGSNERRNQSAEVFEKSGTPGATRTPDLLLRRQTLYPSELQAHRQVFFIIASAAKAVKCRSCAKSAITRSVRESPVSCVIRWPPQFAPPPLRATRQKLTAQMQQPYPAFSGNMI